MESEQGGGQALLSSSAGLRVEAPKRAYALFVEDDASVDRFAEEKLSIRSRAAPPGGWLKQRQIELTPASYQTAGKSAVSSSSMSGILGLIRLSQQHNLNPRPPVMLYQRAAPSDIVDLDFEQGQEKLRRSAATRPGLTI